MPALKVVDADGNFQTVGTGSGGDVVGPSSSTDEAVARFDGVTGKRIQNSGVLIDDSDNVTGVANLNGKVADDLVTGPSSATDNALARFDAATGKVVQDSGLILTDLSADKMTLAPPSVSGPGTALDVEAGPSTAGTGGPLTCNAGDGVSGGALSLLGGDSVTGDAGDATLKAGQSVSSGAAGDAIVQGGSSISGADGRALLKGHDGSTGIEITNDATPLVKFPTYDLDIDTDVEIAQGKRIDFDTDKDTSIRASGDDTMVMEAGGVDTVTVTATALNCTKNLTVNGVAAQAPIYMGGGGMLSAGNLTDVTAMANNLEAHFLYLGRALKAYTAAEMTYRCTTAVTGIGRTCRIGIFKATVNAGAVCGTLTQVATPVDITNTVDATGIFTTTQSSMVIATGDDLWAAIQAGKLSGAAQFRGLLADDIQSGVFNVLAAGNGSLADGPFTAHAIGGAAVVPPWISVVLA